MFNQLQVYKFLHFQTCIFFTFSIIGILSRFENIFSLKRKDILEHILSGFGLSAFSTIILFCIFIFPLAKYFKKKNQVPKTNFSFVHISLLGIILSLMKAIFWEFFNPNNTVNQFEYDLLGIFVYFIVIYYVYSKDKLYITPNKTQEPI
jgi:hypothetical protein